MTGNPLRIDPHYPQSHGLHHDAEIRLCVAVVPGATAFAAAEIPARRVAGIAPRTVGSTTVGVAAGAHPAGSIPLTTALAGGTLLVGKVIRAGRSILSRSMDAVVADTAVRVAVLIDAAQFAHVASVALLLARA
jgi:hypothetical protein